METLDKSSGKLTEDYQCSASMMSSVFNVNPYISCNEALRRCHDALNGKPREEIDNRHIRLGESLENTLIRHTAQELGLLSVEDKITKPFRHENLPLNGSLDGIGVADNLVVEHNPEEGIYLDNKESVRLNGKGVIEIKTSKRSVSDELPDDLGVIQVKSLMSICKFSWAVIGILWRGDFRVYVFERNLEWEMEHLTPKVIDFNRRIKDCEFYPAFTPEDAQFLHPTDDGGLVDLTEDPDVRIAIETYNSSKSLKKVAESNIEESERLIKAKMGNNTYAVCGEHKVTWKNTVIKAKPERVIPAVAESVGNRRFSMRKIDS